MTPTKRTRQALAAELRKAARWTSLEVYLQLKAFKNSMRSGSHDCKCGQRISKTKATCLKCSQEELHLLNIPPTGAEC